MPASSTKKLFLLADGGSLAEYNQRLSIDPDERKLDFGKIPDLVLKQLRAGQVSEPVECSREARIFFTVGSGSAGSFLAKIAEQWTVKTLPITMSCRCEPTATTDKQPRARLRFHGSIGYTLGLLAGMQATKDVILGVVTNDVHILDAMADARSRGLDVRLVWWGAALGEEVTYFAARNQVPVVLIPEEDAALGGIRSTRDSAIEGLLSGVVGAPTRPTSKKVN